MFEITGSGFVAPVPPPRGNNNVLWQNTSTGPTSIGEMSGNTIAGGGPVNPNPGTAWRAVELT